VENSLNRELHPSSTAWKNCLKRRDGPFNGYGPPPSSPEKTNFPITGEMSRVGRELDCTTEAGFHSTVTNSCKGLRRDPAKQAGITTFLPLWPSAKRFRSE